MKTWVRVLALGLVSTYAVYGFATENFVGGVVFTVVAGLIVWAMYRSASTTRTLSEDESAWIAPWLTVTVLAAVLWFIAIYSVVAAMRGEDGRYVFSAIVSVPCAVVLTRIAVPANVWAWRAFRSSESAGAPPE